MRMLTLLMLMFGAVVSAAADERPVVLVEFTFHANTCDKYGDARDAKARDFADVVATEFANEFQFALWRTSSTLKPGEKAEGTLTVQFRAQDELVGPRRYLAYYIDYFRDVKMNGAKIAERGMSSYIGSKAPLYDAHSYARPCGQDLNFTTVLRTRMDDDIRVFRQAWMDNFLRYVPIARNVPDEDTDHDSSVMLPLHWKSLHAGENSKMVLNVGGVERARLNPIINHTKPQEDPLICAHVSLIGKDGVTREMIGEALQSYRADKYIRLFMTDYDRNRDTHNYQPLAQNPD